MPPAPDPVGGNVTLGEALITVRQGIVCAWAAVVAQACAIVTYEFAG